jgi:prepilin-type N-terminal cleavage/methylation domain-containing protein
VTADWRRPAGFSLAEVLVATAIAALALAGAGRLLALAQTAWRADTARAELQQRARAAAAALSRVLLDAGGGAGAGAARGPLIRLLPPIVPRRVGRRGADPAATFRADAFSVLTVVADAEHGELLLPAPSTATTIALAPTPDCTRPACGFIEGETALLVDARGNYDVFTVTAVAANALTLRHHGPGNQAGYAAGSPVLHAEAVTWALDRATSIVRRYDGDASDLPLLDEVVDMRVEYFGERQPPLVPRPTPGEANCLFDADGRPSTPAMAVLQGPGGALVPLSADVLTDGPWCGGGANAFDADLLRVRRLRLTLRLQASDSQVRGADPGRFRRPGTATLAAAMVPDLSVVVDVTPRNLHVAW